LEGLEDVGGGWQKVARRLDEQQMKRIHEGRCMMTEFQLLVNREGHRRSSTSAERSLIMTVSGNPLAGTGTALAVSLSTPTAHVL
jgi:hypothetical protein